MDSSYPKTAPAKLILFALILIPFALNAVLLAPELSIPIPSLNDDAFHYLFIQRASAALAHGENPLDHWMAELELGFPQFFYYQHLPHLAVVSLHRFLLKHIDLFTLFNLIRYLLLVGFPITVYGSMRKMGFSQIAGCVGAAASTLLSSKYGYGFEAGSYLWRGFGMYTQLWAMHLSFITLACLHRQLETGKGRLSAVVACSALALSHLIYAYMIGIAGIVIFLSGLTRSNIKVRLLRLILVAIPALAITSYFWLSFLIQQKFLGASPYLQRWKYDSFGAADVLFSLVNGDLVDFGGLPVLTILLALGIASAFFTQTRCARLALILFTVYLFLFFGRFTWGKSADFLPMHEGLLFHRFIGGVHLAAILLMGLGGERIWEQLVWIPGRWRAMTAGLIFLILMTPAARRHHEYCDFNRQWMERALIALDSDQDAGQILSALKKLPPGRVYAGLRENWGVQIKIEDLNFYDILTFHSIEAVSPPYQGLSFNSDLIWHFDDHRPDHYRLFDIRWVVAPSELKVPEFLQPIYETNRYRLYKAQTGGRGQFARISDTVRVDSQSDLLSMNRTWMAGAGPGEDKFIAYGYKEELRESAVEAKAMGGKASGDQGRIIEETVSQGSIELKVQNPEAATLILKTTFHPNWRVLVDQREVETFMVSPSFIGFNVPAGDHCVRAAYRSPAYKMILMIVGACVLMSCIIFRRR